MILVLLGYMGSGKSTIGKQLAPILGYEFLDLDNYITQRERATISQIFKEKGEIYFRKKETESLLEVLDSQKDLVLALGGGTPCYGDNMQQILKHRDTISIYLHLSIPEIAKRLLKETTKRPLISHLTSEEELIEFIGKHLFERTAFYQLADHTVKTDRKSVKEILEELVMLLV